MKKLFFLILLILMLGCASSTACVYENGVIAAQTSPNKTIVEINGYAIPTLRYNDKLFIPAEILADYGFDVSWINDDRTLLIDRNTEKSIKPYDFSADMYNNSINILSSDISVYCSGIRVFSINADNMVYIDADDIAAIYGTGSYDEAADRCRIWLNDTVYGNVNGISVTQNGLYCWWDIGYTYVEVTQAYYNIDKDIYKTKNKTVLINLMGWNSLKFYNSFNEIILGNVIKSINGKLCSNYDNELSYIMNPANAARITEHEKKCLSVSQTTVYTHEQAMKIAQEVAKRIYGADAIVLPASDQTTPTIVNINGVEREIFAFGADSLTEMSNRGSMRGLFHFDANTGEIFDNSSGEMIKIN